MSITKFLLIAAILVFLWSTLTWLLPNEFAYFPVSTEVSILSAVHGIIQYAIDLAAPFVDWPLFFELLQIWINCFWVLITWAIISLIISKIQFSQ